jgi:hypothetical protein
MNSMANMGVDKKTIFLPVVLDNSEQLPPYDCGQCKYESQTIVAWPGTEFYEKVGKFFDCSEPWLDHWLFKNKLLTLK